MGIAVGQAAPPVEVPVGGRLGERTRGGLRYLGRNRQLVLGIVLLGALALFVILGLIFSTDPVLLDYYSGISPTTPVPTSPAPSSPLPGSPAPTPGASTSA